MSAPAAPQFPLPETDWPVAGAFYAAAARGELVIPRCASCARFVWYPEDACPHCEGGDLPWTRVSGRGTLYSWAVVRRALVPVFADSVPFVSALVALEEAPEVRLVTRVVDCAPDALRPEMALCVVFRSLSFTGVAGEITAPLFAPA